MVTFFVLLAHKITSSIMSNLFLCNPLGIADTGYYLLVPHLAALLTADPPSSQRRCAAYADGPDQLDGALIRPVYPDVFFAIVAKKLPYSILVR